MQNTLPQFNLISESATIRERVKLRSSSRCFRDDFDFSIEAGQSLSGKFYNFSNLKVLFFDSAFLIFQKI